MKGDFTRLTFDPTKHYRGVLMQQGRVQLDADWNEQVQIAEHRYSTFFDDFVGRNGAPIGDALRVEYDVTKKQLVVRPGHYYAHGILVENENDLFLELPTGTYLLYLDVWPRHITAAEDPELREPALGGPDTTTRLKTEWQVRWQSLGDTSLDKVVLTDFGPNWQFRPSTGTGELEAKLAPESSFGLDNRLYRIQIFDGDPEPTFVWSADNGAIAAKVLPPTDSAHLGDRIALDETEERVATLFPRGAIIEVADEVHTLRCEPGLMATVSDIDGRWLIVNWQNAAVASARTWDKQVLVRAWEALPAKLPSTWNPLGKSGLQIRFESQRTPAYYAGDYWLITTRAGAILKRDSLRPHGVHHHYAALAAVQITDSEPSIKNLCVLFEPLTSDNSIKAGDLCVRGKLGVGLQDRELLHAPINVQPDPKGQLIEFYNGEQPSWHIQEVEGALRIGGTEDGLYINKQGYVGVSTKNPQHPLTIQGSIIRRIGPIVPLVGPVVSPLGPILPPVEPIIPLMSALPGSLALQTSGVPRKGGIFGQICFGSDDNHEHVQYPIRILGVAESNVDGDHAASGQLQFQTIAPNSPLDSDPTTKMVITGTGNVGIGTLDPQQKLTLDSGNILLPSANQGIDGNLYFGGRTNEGELGMRLFGGIVNRNALRGEIHAGFIDVKTDHGHDGLRFRVDTVQGKTERMRITADGNVGIGTTDTSKARLVVDGDIYVTGSVISSNLPIYREKNEITIIDTTLNDDRAASLFNVWVDLNQTTTLNIVFSIPHISYVFDEKDFLCGSLLTFEIQNQEGALISINNATIPIALSLEPQIFQKTVPNLIAGLYRLGVKLVMGRGGKAYIDGMLLAVKKSE